MYAESPDSLTVELGPSRVLTAVLVLLHFGAVVLALVVPLALVFRATLVILIALSFYVGVYRHGLRRGGNAIVALMLSGEDECAVRRRNTTEWETGRVVDRWVQPWLTILTVRSDARRWSTSIVICADAVAPDAFRRLRVRLRLRTEAARV